MHPVDRVNILLVDDQPSRLLTYEAILSDLGERLISATSVTEALGCLLENDIAIVLTDVNMPGLDGFYLADSIRGHPRFRDIAIIFVSGAYMTDTDRLKGYDHGAVDYVFLPIIPELLRAKVRVFAELYRKTRRLEILNQDMQRASGRMIAAQDEERRRMARELHDGLGQELSLAKVLVDGLVAADSRGRAREASALIATALQQLRSLSHLLHPPLLDELGLECAVRWYLEGLAKRSGMATSFEVEPSEFPRLIPQLENAIYRIIQEALTNAFRHSGTTKVCVTLRKEGEYVSLAVRDFGKGIPEDLAACRPGTQGVGLGGMRQRVKEFGGEFKLSKADPGTTVEVLVPYVAADGPLLYAVSH